MELTAKDGLVRFRLKYFSFITDKVLFDELIIVLLSYIVVKEIICFLPGVTSEKCFKNEVDGRESQMEIRGHRRQVAFERLCRRLKILYRNTFVLVHSLVD